VHLQIGVAIHRSNSARKFIQRRRIDQMHGKTERNADGYGECRQDDACRMGPPFARDHPSCGDAADPLARQRT
jgi:hypothetical protein